MSKQEREKAIDIVANYLLSTYSQTRESSLRDIADGVLNRLLRAGYLNDRVSVHVDEVKDELDKAVFKCKVEE